MYKQIISQPTFDGKLGIMTVTAVGEFKYITGKAGA
jgi:hypothetical protein